MSEFPLSGDAIEDTIAVTVDGVTSSDWYYEQSSNAVIFTTSPDDGSSIEVDYAIWGCN